MSDENVKEQQFDEEGNPIYPKLSDALYWEWRTTIEELESSRLRVKISEHQKQVMSRDLEIFSLKSTILKYNLNKASGEVASAKKTVESYEAEYEKMKEKIEKELDITLENKVIDPFTYEVKDSE